MASTADSPVRSRSAARIGPRTKRPIRSARNADFTRAPVRTAATSRTHDSSARPALAATSPSTASVVREPVAAYGAVTNWLITSASSVA
nr:hypothetical protein [Actinospica acidithermotolerans]